MANGIVKITERAYINLNAFGGVSIENYEPKKFMVVVYLMGGAINIGEFIALEEAQKEMQRILDLIEKAVNTGKP